MANHALRRAGLRYIAWRGDHRVALCPQPFHRGGAAGIIRKVIERDLGFAPGEQLNRRQPNAGGRARHQGGLAPKAHHRIGLERKVL
jgi:hypothetical protein